MTRHAATKALLVTAVCCLFSTAGLLAQSPKSGVWEKKRGKDSRKPAEVLKKPAPEGGDEGVSEKPAPDKAAPADAPAADKTGETGRLGLTQHQDDFAQALAHFAVGYLYESVRDNDAALDEYTKVLQFDPTREEVAVKVGTELLRRRENKHAIQILEQVTAKSPKNYGLQIMLSVAYRAEHRWEEAIKAARAAQKADPKKIAPYQSIMEVSLDNGNAKEALKTLQSAANQKVDEYRYWLQLGELFTLLREREPSLEIPPDQISDQYEKALALNPEEPEVLVRLADHFLYTKNLKRAIELYLKILERQPDAIDIYQKLALSYVQDGDKKQAISTLEEIVKKEPLKYQIHNLIGELNESLKDWAAARTAYKSSIIVNPDQLENYLKVCLLELRLQNPAGAFEILKKAKEKFPDMPQVPYFHGLAYSELKDYPKSVMAFEEAYLMSQTNPNIRLESDFYFYYGAACERNGEFERAVNLFKKAIELNPDYADAYNYLGYMYADKGINLDESLKLIEKAISYEPNNGAFIDSLGWIYYRLGKYDQALVELQKAVDLIKDDSVVFEHLGDVYQKLGKKDQAAIQWQKAFQHDPKNEALLKKLKDVGVDPAAVPPLDPTSDGGAVHSPSKVPEKKL